MPKKVKSNKPGIGVFLCGCGQKIEPKVDLAALEKTIKANPLVSHVEVQAFPCMVPGLEAIKEAVTAHNLDRIIIAGCESRIMLKKFEGELAEVGLEQGQIDIINLRDHVAQVHDSEPAELAVKGAKLINAGVASLSALTPTPKVRVDFNGPVMILGGGISTYSAAQELLRREIDTIISVHTDDVEDEIRMLHEHYPGERDYHDRLRQIMAEVDQSPYIKKITEGELEKVMGRVGDYTVTFTSDDHQPPRFYQVGAIIAALDGQMLNQGTDFGHDGVKVLCHTELEEHIWIHGVPDNRVVFWVNDLETGRPWEFLSARAAWNLACFIRGHSFKSQVSILFNEEMNVPLSAGELALARELNITWVPYDASIRPTVQSGYITFNRSHDQIEQELPWDMLVLSPLRSTGVESMKVAKILGVDVFEDEFLERSPQMVRPDQVGLAEKLITGSARQPCDLRESLRQGRRAAARVAEIAEKAAAGELYAPRMVCTVDSTKCIGCGLCREICDCGGIQPVDGPGGNVPRSVDPMLCTGGGTCAAACPYHALVLQNNTTAQREARVAALALSLGEGEVMGFGCSWGGCAAADHAGLEGLRYDPRFHLLPVGCLGQLDPSVMARAFLEGANGLLLIGCPPEECHHSYGLDHSCSRANIVKKLLSLCGIERERIALAHGNMSKPEMYVRTVESFLARMDQLGPINRDESTASRIRSMYDTLQNTRVRWILGAGLRRPHEATYPADQRNALAFDESLTGIVAEEFLRTRLTNLLHKSKQVMRLEEISKNLEVEKQTDVLHCLKEMSSEGLISRVFKDRVPYYTML